mmetsp:Transcript_16777/g.41925  ORF Transcript_16777/g.41925 Transcript_16777/m.41925 type:complete len:711 (-) Transcript_16777:2614-4746(-)
MSGRMDSFLGRLVWLFCLTAAAASEGVDDTVPKFVLVEDHHHVISPIVKFAREGVLKSHGIPPEEERSPNGAVVIHIDSHADMGLPPGYNDLPAAKLFSNLPPEFTPEEIELLEHSKINDFLLFLGYMGIVEHIIFVEPPWALLLRNARFATVDISMGVIPDKEGAVYASIRESPKTTFPDQEISEYGFWDLRDMMGDPDQRAEVVSHEELLEHCGKSDDCTLRTVRFTTLPYQGAAEAIKTILDSEHDKDRDVILDIDLDGFSTTSPGALSLFHSVIPDYEILGRIFHTLHHDLCDMGREYWEQLKQMGGKRAEEEICESQNQNYVFGPPFQPPEGGPIATNGKPSERAYKILEDLMFYFKVEEDAEQERALAEVFEYFLPAIDAWAYDDDKFINMLDAFLVQPYYVPEAETIHPILEFHFDHLFKTIFEDRTPAVVNVVRSPFYCPDHHLEFIECEVFGRLLDMFGNKSGASPSLYHFQEVDVDRTNCLADPNKFPPSNRVSIGTNSNIDAVAWQWTHKTYTWFMEDDDEFWGTGYKYNGIWVEFVNEHKHPLWLKHLHFDTILVAPGERITKEAHHMTRWDLYEAKDNEETISSPALQTIYLNGKKGQKQSYGSISGSIPVHYSTPVKMKVENPDDSGIHVVLKSADEYEEVPQGYIRTLHTVHGQRWSIHRVFQNLEEQLGEVIANATLGEMHSVKLFSDESTSEL